MLPIINPTGNSTFDTTAASAWATMQQYLSSQRAQRDGGVLAHFNAEKGYLLSLWRAAMLQIAQGGINATTPASQAGNIAPTQYFASGIQTLATGLATQLRDTYKVTLPPGYYAVTGNSIVSGGTGTWAQGDTVSLTATLDTQPANSGPIQFLTSTVVNATFTVATASAGAIATMTNLAQGIYEGSFPTGTMNLVKIVSASGTGSPTATVTCTFYPTLYLS